MSSRAAIKTHEVGGLRPRKPFSGVEGHSQPLSVLGNCVILSGLGRPAATAITMRGRESIGYSLAPMRRRRVLRVEGPV